MNFDIPMSSVIAIVMAIAIFVMGKMFRMSIRVLELRLESERKSHNREKNNLNRENENLSTLIKKAEHDLSVAQELLYQATGQCAHKWFVRYAYVRRPRPRSGARRLNTQFREVERRHCPKCNTTQERVETTGMTKYRDIDIGYFAIASLDAHRSGRREAKEILTCRRCRKDNVVWRSTFKVANATIPEGWDYVVAGVCPSCRAGHTFDFEDMRWYRIDMAREKQRQIIQEEEGSNRARRQLNL